jgi:transcriptional regulator with XRE-family HTH domain
MAKAIIDPGMTKIQEIWAAKQAAGWTLQRLGEAMGYPSQSADRSAWQFLRSSDPRLSTVRRFARAVGVSVATLVR